MEDENQTPKTLDGRAVVNIFLDKLKYIMDNDPGDSVIYYQNQIRNLMIEMEKLNQTKPS